MAYLRFALSTARHAGLEFDTECPLAGFPLRKTTKSKDIPLQNNLLTLMVAS
ncbi:MAG: hypothetical protein ACOYYS_21440 [Chloroflexota bacterium]